MGIHLTKDFKRWLGAIVAFDHGDADPLAALMLSESPVPTRLRPALADIITGARKPNKKSAAKATIPARDRGEIAFSILDLREIALAVRRDARGDELNSNLTRGYELHEIANDTTGKVTGFVDEIARHYGVTPRTINDVVADMRRRILALARAQ
jgi:hypothetical protein